MTQKEHDNFKLEMYREDLAKLQEQTTNLHAELVKTEKGIEAMENEARWYKNEIKQREKQIAVVKSNIELYS